MSLRTFQRVAMMSVLALGALGASGCDDDKKDTTDGGGTTGGTEDGGGKNTGGEDANTGEADTGTPPKKGIDCGDTFCEKGPAILGQCCAGADEDICGIDLKPPTPDAVSLGCFEQDAPGVASPSCIEVLNNFEMDGKDDKKFEISAGGTAIKLDGCCTPAGTCGVNATTSSVGDLGLGCLDALNLAPPPSGDAGAGDGGAPGLPTEANGLPILPNTFCDAKTGEPGCIPATFMGQSVPPFLLGACPATIDDTNDCIVGVEQNIRGCGETEKWDRASLQALCIDNIAADKWGCDPISAATLARIPGFACGCGLGATPGAGGPCLSNVEVGTCGSIPVPTQAKPGATGVQCVAPFPEFMTGCGEATGPTSYPAQCIPNVAATVVGCAEVIKGSAVLNGLPNGACGCGEAVVNTVPPGPGFCLSYAAQDACGLIPACAEGAACDPAGAGTVGTCLDLTGTEGTTPSTGPGGTTNGDDIGDYCYEAPPT